MPSPTEISVERLARLIGTPEAPVVLDVRLDEDVAEDPRLIPSAARHPFDRTPALAPRLGGAEVVVVCQKGLKISQGAAAALRAHGVRAKHLGGGAVGWRDAGLPLAPLARLPRRNAEGRTVWATRWRPGIDGLACAWLIRRFVDRGAMFLFVAPSEVAEAARRFGATPFDVPDVVWSRRGDRRVFDVMIDELALETEPLRRLARIVRGADADRHDLAPQAAGLLAASLGLSAMRGDDLRRLEDGMILHDAFHRWARDAADESRDGTPASAGAAS